MSIPEFEPIRYEHPKGEVGEPEIDQLREGLRGPFFEIEHIDPNQEASENPNTDNEIDPSEKRLDLVIISLVESYGLTKEWKRQKIQLSRSSFEPNELTAPNHKTMAQTSIRQLVRYQETTEPALDGDSPPALLTFGKTKSDEILDGLKKFLEYEARSPLTGDKQPRSEILDPNLVKFKLLQYYRATHHPVAQILDYAEKRFKIEKHAEEAYSMQFVLSTQLELVKNIYKDYMKALKLSVKEES